MGADEHCVGTTTSITATRDDLRVGPEVVKCRRHSHGLHHLRHNRFYVVAYDGVDPVSGRERRRWHSAGTSRADAEAIASSITETNRVPIPRGRDALTLTDYLTNTWLPERQRRVRATTAYRYGWMIERYIAPTVGQYALRSIRTEHLNDFYTALTAGGGQHGDGLAGKTVHEVHLIVRSALTQPPSKGAHAATPHYAPNVHDRTPAHAADPKRGPPQSSTPS